MAIYKVWQCSVVFAENTEVPDWVYENITKEMHSIIVKSGLELLGCFPSVEGTLTAEQIAQIDLEVIERNRIVTQAVFMDFINTGELKYLPVVHEDGYILGQYLDNVDKVVARVHMIGGTSPNAWRWEIM